MKKTLIVLSVMLCLILAAGIASAATFEIYGPTGTTAAIGTNVGGTAASPTVTVYPSSNVHISYNGASQAYAAAAEHKAGTRVYGTGSNAPAIYYTTKAESAIGTFTASMSSCIFDSTGYTAQ